MQIATHETTPLLGQKPGTSGLRKKTKIFMEPHYLENYIQSIFDVVMPRDQARLVVGGDGRYFNDRAIQVILRMAFANGFVRVIVTKGGLLSTPAASNLIRERRAIGGIILSASHNPGGPEEDFGVKYNLGTGGPAPEEVTEAIYKRSREIDSYKILERQDFDISTPGISEVGDALLEVVDPIELYAEKMEELFDFDAIRDLFASGFTMRFDAMHAVTGPYAKRILEEMLGAPEGTVINGDPSPDFGGGHPDPNPVWAKDLMDLMMGPDAPDFGAASDGDGDRNMIVGKGCYVTPSDSLALLAAQAEAAPMFAGGVPGVARSMPTSTAVDRVAEAKKFALYETPTGWKYFGNLLDAGWVRICGEESAGTGADHVREKDGLWAVLLWLNILAKRRMSVAELMAEHWATYGRNYYSRHDYEAVDAEAAEAMIERLRGRVGSMAGQSFAGLVVASADDFSYYDLVADATTARQGIRVIFEGGSRIVLRLSGTGTVGATLRVYLERFEPDPAQHGLDPQAALADVIAAAEEIAGIKATTGREAPDVIT